MFVDIRVCYATQGSFPQSEKIIGIKIGEVGLRIVRVVEFMLPRALTSSYSRTYLPLSKDGGGGERNCVAS